MSMSFGGGSMWRGLRGPAVGRTASAASRKGDPGPFVGIPPELETPVRKLVATEPDHGEPTAVFTPRNTDRRPLTLGRLLRRRWRVAIVALALVALESVGYQTGPYLTQIGIDSGIAKHRIGVLVATGLIYLNDEAEELHGVLGTTARPLNELSEGELCPGAKALAAINASLR